MSYEAVLVVAASKKEVPAKLNALVAERCEEAMNARGVFTIALSGGSLPSLLSSLKEAFDARGSDPHFDRWHVILADERCVPSKHEDSNMGALQANLFNSVAIPSSQIHGINEEKLNDSTTSAVAEDYEAVVRSVLEKSGGQLDLAVLGFGPDGHTCSLFPDHPLLQENEKWVAPIEDSPKPPPRRITLTYPVLNTHTRHVIFCGAGGSKSHILKELFASADKKDDESIRVTMKDPAPYPCGRVRPDSQGETNRLAWVVDADAMSGVSVDTS